jgi:hypothetical protein
LETRSGFLEKTLLPLAHVPSWIDYKPLGPFKIAKLVGLVACQLELPLQFMESSYTLSFGEVILFLKLLGNLLET